MRVDACLYVNLFVYICGCMREPSLPRAHSLADPLAHSAVHLDSADVKNGAGLGPKEEGPAGGAGSANGKVAAAQAPAPPAEESGLGAGKHSPLNEIQEGAGPRERNNESGPLLHLLSNGNIITITYTSFWMTCTAGDFYVSKAKSRMLLKDRYQ
jgi:hypothetical protein